jgi:hypothetical protein
MRVGAFQPRIGPSAGKVGNVLFALGDPDALEWWCRGRKATRLEILDAIHSGLPLLRQMAEQDGPMAVDEFNRQCARVLELVPRETTPPDHPAPGDLGSVPL